MSGKGDDRRPLSVDEQTFSDNWERIFKAKSDYYDSVKQANYANSLRLEGLMGSGVTGSTSSSNLEGSRSSLDSPATHEPVYVNSDTGEQVTEAWWPTIEEPK